MLAIRVLVRLAPQDIPRLQDTRIDVTVLLLTLGTSLLAGLVFGLLPAWQSADSNPLEALKGCGRNLGSGRSRTRELLIIAELALCVPLAIGAALLLQSVIKLLDVDSGFKSDRVFAAIIVLQNSRYNTQESQLLFFNKLLQNLKMLSAVESAATVDGIPLSGNITGSYLKIEGHSLTAEGNDRPAAEVFSVSPDYTSVMGIPLISGRMLQPEDSNGGYRSILVDDTAVRQFWPGEDPLGKRLYFDGVDKPGDWRQVVGVVKTTRDAALDESGRPAMYVPAEQGVSLSNFLVVKAKTANADLTRDIRQAVMSVDKDQPVFLVTSMRELVNNSAAVRRFSASMLSLFGALATILAAIGVDGVVSYSVGNRTQEIGIRMALGASRVTILRLILDGIMIRTVIGLVVGVATSFALTRLITSLLFEVNATDFGTFVGVPASLVIVALAACYLRARRASKVDPMVCLRYE